VVGSAIGALLSLAFGPPEFLYSATTAAWAQAITTVAAVAVALYVANQQAIASRQMRDDDARSERDKEFRRATALAARITPLLFDLNKSIETSIAICDRHIEYFSKGPNYRYDLELAMLGVVVPQDLFGDLWTFPSEDTLQICNTLLSAQRFDRTFATGARYMKDSESTKIVDFAKHSLNSLHKLRHEVDICFRIAAKYADKLARDDPPPPDEEPLPGAAPAS